MEKKSLKLNFIMNAILTMSSIIFPLITFPYISRILLPEGTGKVNLAASVIAYFNMFAQLGIPTYGIKACAKVRDDRGQLTRTVHELAFINIIMSAVAYIALAIVIAAVPRIREEKTLYIIYSITIILSAIGMEWLYQGLEEYSYITKRSLLFKAIAVIAMLLMIHEQEDYIIYAAITVFATGASNVTNLINSRKYIDLKWQGGYNLKRHFKVILVFFALACTTTIYTNLDNVMLGFMTTNAEVGLYSAAIKIKTLLISLITSLGAVLLPRASFYIEKGDNKEFERITKKAMQFVVMAALPIVIYFTIYADECIRLIAGEAFADAALSMQIIMPTVLFIGITNLLGLEIMVPTGRERSVLYSTIIGAVVDIILNAVFIPQYGAVGAAIGTVCAEFAVLIYQVVYLKDEARSAFESVPIIRIILACILAGIAAVLLKKVECGIFLKLIISAIVFFGLYCVLMIDYIIKICFGDKAIKQEQKMSCQISYFKAILKAIKEKIVGIIVIAVICGIAIGGFGYVKAKNTQNYVEENKKEIEEYNDKVAEYETAIRDTEDYIKLQQEQIDDLQNYIDNSIIMSLNGEAIPTSNVQWTLTAESADKNAVLNTLRTYIVEGELREAVRNVDASLKPQYWNEVMSVNAGGDVLSVSIMQPTEELSQQSIEIIAENINKHLPDLVSTYGNLALNDEIISTSIKADAGVVSTQNSYRDTLKNYKYTHSDQSNRLASQKESLKKYQEENAPEVYEDISNSAKKNAIKYAIIGIVIGLILGIAIVIIDYCICGRLKVAEDVKKYGLALLAKRNKDKIIPGVERACMDIENFLHTYELQAVSFCCLSEADEQMDLGETFGRHLDSMGISSKVLANADKSAESMGTMIKCKCTCLILSAGKTEIRRLEEIIAMCKQYGITIIGCIVAC